MKFLIKNTDKESSMLLSAIEKDSEYKIPFIGENKPERVVLRPGEENNFTLNDNYLLGIEKL